MIAAPLSLYLVLKPKTKADLEVVANAALAFADLVRETAFVIDPTLDVRIEFDSGTPGSLSVNALIKNIAKKATDPKTLGAVVLAVGLHFRHELASWSTQKLFDIVIVDGDKQTTLSDGDIQKISERVSKLINTNKGPGIPQAQRIFHELEYDTAIEGVGVTPKAGERPASIVPREEFRLRGSLDDPTDVTPKKRRTKYTGTLTMVMPRLARDDRIWKFRGQQGAEFGAHIDDTQFRDRVLSGQVRMREGTQIDVVMETIEEFDGQVWRAGDRHITKVKGVKRHHHQPSLPLGKPPKKKGRAGKK